MSPQSHALRAPATGRVWVMLPLLELFKTSECPFERRSDSVEDLQSHRYAQLLFREECSMRVENARNAELAFVLSKQGVPLMPCSPARARKLLESGKAKVIKRVPFVIKLKFGSTGYLQPITAGEDTGSKYIGCAAIANGQVVYQSQIELRNDVSSKLNQRKMYRRTKRSRKTRYRAPRFNNRGKKGKIEPSVKSKIDSHIRERNFVQSILPVTDWRAELSSFDIHKISNPQVSSFNGWTYQQGAQKDFYNLKAYILHRDEYTCQHCSKNKSVKLHVHHIQFRSEGGTDTPDNLITLCETCHDKLHLGNLGATVHEKLKKKTRSKTKHATEMGIIQSQLKKSDWIFEETFGYETKYKREQILGYPKSHHADAVAICLTEGKVVDFNPVVYFKKHVSKGDYQLTSGARSEQKIPVRKLFGFRKFDLIQTSRGIGFVKGKRSSG
jgi:5-methylcytosine-specific restriction endonuclease McrA